MSDNHAIRQVKLTVKLKFVNQKKVKAKMFAQLEKENTRPRKRIAIYSLPQSN
ncbi:hypothetical protein [Scytonema sp. PRP1]|uniref:hypothetical protein n=1 Tax=Scytonema sp. PRP1 TaxID=3120513 RepID=UPI002FCFDAFB